MCLIKCPNGCLTKMNLDSTTVKEFVVSSGFSVSWVVVDYCMFRQVSNSLADKGTGEVLSQIVRGKQDYILD